MKVISWKNKPIFTEMFLLFTRETQFHMVKKALSMPLTIICNFVWVINLTMGGNWPVTWPPIIGTRYVIFATT